MAKEMRFFYTHASAPYWFSEATVLSSLRAATRAWSQCAVPASVEVVPASGIIPKGAIAVVWDEEGSRHNFGLANLGNKTLSLGPSAFQLLRTRNPAYDSRQTLQMVISHEMGHLFGVVAHSRRCVDVMSYYDDGQGGQCSIHGGVHRPAGVEYRATLPTACDIRRCLDANARAQ